MDELLAAARSIVVDNTNPSPQDRATLISIGHARRTHDAGFDEVHVLQIGPRQQPMLDFCARSVLPRFT